MKYKKHIAVVVFAICLAFFAGLPEEDLSFAIYFSAAVILLALGLILRRLEQILELAEKRFDHETKQSANNTSTH